MLVGGVVENEVQHQTHALLAKFRGELPEFFHGADRWVHLAVAADGVATIIVAIRALEEWHQVQVGDSQLLEIADFLAQAAEVTGEQVDVSHRPNHAVRLIPVRVAFADGIEALQVRIARQPRLAQVRRICSTWKKKSAVVRRPARADRRARGNVARACPRRLPTRRFDVRREALPQPGSSRWSGDAPWIVGAGSSMGDQTRHATHASRHGSTESIDSDGGEGTSRPGPRAVRQQPRQNIRAQASTATP